MSLKSVMWENRQLRVNGELLFSV